MKGGEKRSSDSFPTVLLQRIEGADIKGLEWVCRVRRKAKYNNVASTTPLRL